MNSATFTAHVDVPCAGTSPRLARDLLSHVLDGWGHARQIHDARLVVSELVTNAVVHGPDGSPIAVDLHVNPDFSLCLAVRDGSTVPAVIGREDPAAGESGRGMLIIENLCADWGSQPVPGGKRTWALLL